jgi:biotin carboxyl carrier protein
MEIKARIPGAIVAVKVNVGDVVKMKTILATLEAMKMEQPIACPIDGTIKEAKVKVGDKVKTGDVMFVVE